jgi:NAD(P)-dependent dehydrogenase (short-subunit alcohol dehydrogenase family)
MTVSFDLSGRLAVVTGVRRGIGLAIADALAGAGADILGVSASLEKAGSDAQRIVEAHGRSFEAHTVDFADRAAVTAFGELLAARERPVDILVNNAGTIERAPAAEHPLELWDKVLEVNLSSQFVLSQLLGRGQPPEFSGRHQRAGVHGIQIGRLWPRESTVERVGLPGCHSERDRAGLYQHRQHEGASRRRRPLSIHPRPHSRRTLG